MIFSMVIAFVVTFVAASWSVDRRRRRRNERLDAEGRLDPSQHFVADATELPARSFDSERAIAEAAMYDGRHMGGGR